jgi:hypothetical protein
MSYDEEVRAGQNWKNCKVCNVDYLDDCPSCNPTNLYFVKRMVADGPDDFTYEECECDDVDCQAGFWDLKAAKAHATELGEGHIVEDKDGREVWNT